MIGILEKLDFEKMAHERWISRLVAKAGDFLGIQPGCGDSRLESLKVRALSAHSNLDEAGWQLEACLYFLTLLVHLGGWDEKVHEHWHGVTESNGLGISCATGQALAAMAWTALGHASDEGELRMLLRARFNAVNDPSDFAANVWEHIEKNVELTREGCKTLSSGIADLLERIADWGPWAPEIGDAVTAIDAVAAANPKLAVSMAVQSLIYAVNAGVLPDEVMGEVWTLFEANGYARPPIPEPGERRGTDLRAQIEGAIRNALGSLGQDVE